MTFLAYHCVKSVQILSYFWSVFSCIRTEYGDLLCKIQIRKNSVFERSDILVTILHKRLSNIISVAKVFQEGNCKDMSFIYVNHVLIKNVKTISKNQLVLSPDYPSVN